VEERGLPPHEVMEMIYAKGRDNARTPVQWDDSQHGGFTTGTPWIKVNPNYREINVKDALADPNSIWHYYRRLIHLRKEHPAIVYGKYDLILEAHEEIYAFTRTLANERLLIILNFTSNTPVFALPTHITFAESKLLIANYEVDPSEEISLLTLRPYEARVYRLSG
jgi:oligo-1,6-glucosidase